ncbi:390_t:CDS:1, partial [Scutellospora calospora]
LVDKNFASYFIPILWKKHAHNYISNKFKFWKGKALVDILYNGLPEDYQKLLSDKEIYTETYDSFLDS